MTSLGYGGLQNAFLGIIEFVMICEIERFVVPYNLKPLDLAEFIRVHVIMVMKVWVKQSSSVQLCN